MKQRQLIILIHEEKKCSVAVWQRQPNNDNSSTDFDTRNLKHNDLKTEFITINSRKVQELIDFNNSDGKITTACQVRKNNISDDLNGNSNVFERLDRNPEKLVARLCSEPQKGDLVRESEKSRNLNSSLCTLVHANVTEKMSSNLRESINLDQTEENSDVPCHMSDYLGTSKKSEQPSKRPIESVEIGEFVSHQRNQESSVENSDYLSSNEENLKFVAFRKILGCIRKCSIQIMKIWKYETKKSI